MRQLETGNAQVIYTKAGQRVIKNVEGSGSRYFPAYDEVAKHCTVYRLTQEDKIHIAQTVIKQLVGISVDIQEITDVQWENISNTMWKEITYGDLFSEYACDGSGEFGHNVCKFKLNDE